MNDINIHWKSLFNKQGAAQFNDGDACLVFDEQAKVRIAGFYLGKFNTKKKQWDGLDGHSWLPFNESMKAVTLHCIDGFSKLSDCQVMPLEHDVYLVKRYIEYKQLRYNGLDYAYFIATRFNDFCPSFWYIDSWVIPCELYTNRGFECVDGCAVVMVDKDDEFIKLNQRRY